MERVTNNLHQSSERHRPYTFVTNSRGRRILVVNSLFNISQTAEISSDDFDAIYINVAHRSYEENRLVVRWFSPTRVQKCFLKPRFATTSLEEFMRFADHLIDGYSESATDESFADFIEEIYNNIERHGIQRTMASGNLTTTSQILANIVKFDISRNRFTFTNYTVRSLTRGYTSIFLSWYDNQETLQFEERMKFNLKVEELGFAEKSKFIDRIHVCPSCGDSHLLFIESCPKCHSSDISQEEMIHHFRCANISPESTYAYDGQLVCPKCRHVLRHIGVDYDRPATVYSCNTCNNTFLASAMKVRCTNCETESTPEELHPADVWEYKLTPTGIAAFATDDAIFQIESNDIYSGRSVYESFIESIRMFNKLLSYQQNSIFVFRYNYIYEGDQENWQIFDIMRTVVSRIATVKITTQDSNFYILVVVHNNRLESDHDRIRKILDQVFHDYTSSNDDLTVSWMKTYRLTHGDDTEDFIYQLGEKIDPEVTGDEVVITE